ncbi:MAG TPA: biopolymer transporter ExbD [Pirellula sp.]|nr:biopolymer transporter ExbD [Pirellula sp.]
MSDANLEEEPLPVELSDDSELEPVSLGERPPLDDEMDITPMIDMVFLLLIFFILTSKMTGEKTYPVPPAKHGSSVVIKNCISILVSRGAGGTPVVARGDGKTFSEDPELQQAEIAEYIQLELDSGRKTEVLVRAEGNVTSGQMKKVKQAIAEVLEEGKMINIAVSEAS